MKKNPVKIKELDVQAISDEDLATFSGAREAEGGSDLWVCTCNSSIWTCYWIVDQER